MPYEFGARVTSTRQLVKVTMKGRVKADRSVEAVTSGRPVNTAPTSTASPRVYWKHPYSSDSYWNMTLRDGVTYMPSTDPGTISITREQDANGVYLKNSDGSIKYISAIINTDSWTWATWFPKASDPQYQIRSTSGTVYVTVPVPPDWKIPGPAAPAERDGWVTIFMPDGASAIDCYKTTAVYSGSTLSHFTVSRAPARSDLTGLGHVMNTTGINTTASSWGMRASTFSYPGGALRKHEVMGKKIDHAIQIALPNGALKAGFVYPARAQDSNAATAYLGDLPMGSRLALPPDLDIDGIGLSSAEGKALAKALQQYGMIVGDRSTTASITAERPNSSHADYALYLAALNRTITDWKVLHKRLVRVTGISSTAPAGPGDIRPEWGELPEGTLEPVY